MRTSFALVVCLLLSCLTASGAFATITFDFEQPLFSEPPEPVLDHCVVEQDGLYHLFYLRGNPAVNIGHATTTDFSHWTLGPPVLDPGTWDDKLWAPYIVKSDGTWFMYYTGVNVPGAQQTGIALSSDLLSWHKLDQPVYHPDTSWAVWDENTFCHGRDPHVIEYDGLYYLFVTAQHEWYKGAVACATSPDLIHWTDAGFIYLHNSWHMLESVFILRRNGLFHMFFTEEGIFGTSHMSSPTLFGGWDINQRHYIDNGHAPQITETPDGDVFSRHSVYNDMHGNLRYVLRFSPMVWFNDLPAVPKPFPLLGEWTATYGDAFYYQPTFSNNAAVRNEIYPSSFVGDGWINTYELYTGPIGFGSPGQAQGDYRLGVIRSKPFQITGNSINLLVGGGDFPDTCYVALVDTLTGQPIFRETGRNSNVMDRRYWDVSSHVGQTVYIEIADLSTDYFGHICVDDIIESRERIGPPPSPGGGTTKKKRALEEISAASPSALARARLLPNTPNPFNPTTSIVFETPSEARVRIDVFDAAGAVVRTLVDESKPAGMYRIVWDGRDRAGIAAASGVYFARLLVNGTLIDTRKLALLK